MYKNLFAALLLFFFVNNLFAQTGLNFQGVARSSNGIILASQAITVRLSILQGSSTGNVLYQETKSVTTNAQGLFNIVIGDATSATSTTGSYQNITWNTPPHYIRFEMDPAAGNNFTTLGTTQLQYVAYAQFANGVAAEKIIGLVPVSKGGTGVGTLQELKQNLQLNNVNNTADQDKPISLAVKSAIDAKLNISDSTIGYVTPAQLNNSIKKFDTSFIYNALSTKVNSSVFSLSVNLKEDNSNKSTATDLGGNNPSDVLYPTQKAVKTYITANLNAGGVADGGITTNKIADGAITNQKIAGVIPVNLGGTGVTTITDFKSILGLGSAAYSNTSNFEAPLVFSAPFSRASSTISIPASNTNTNGYLSSTDWNIFYNKQAAFNNQAPNLIFAGPITGANALPSFRGLHLNDIPDLSSVYLKKNYDIYGNIVYGSNSFINDLGGADNTVIGVNSQANSQYGNFNTSVGSNALNGITYSSDRNTVIGYGADAIEVAPYYYITNSSAIGADSKVKSSNATAIGANAEVTEDNTIQLGDDGTTTNTPITFVKTSGKLKLGTVTYPNSHNTTSNQSLIIDNLGIANWGTISLNNTTGTLGINRGGTGQTTLPSGILKSDGNSIIAASESDLFTSNKNANLVFAGPSSGGAAVPGFRALVANDIPAGSNNYIANSTNQQTANLNITGTATIGTSINVKGITIGVGPVDNQTLVIGNQALQNNSAAYNIAIGNNSLKSNTTGQSNIAVGYEALKTQTTGYSNTAMGYQSMLVNTTGFDNSAYGWQSLLANTTGYFNNAFGNWALMSNVNGNYNVAIGNSALQRNISGSDNTGTGNYSLGWLTTGSKNTASGVLAGADLTTENNTTAIGYNARPIGNNSTSIGAYSRAYDGNSTSLGYNASALGGSDVAIGSGAQSQINSVAVGKGASAAGLNSIAIGFEALSAGSNIVQLGNNSIGYVYSSGTFSTNSDRRIKKDIADIPYGLESILKLKPVKYTLKSNDQHQIGFIAQELQKVIPELVSGNEGDLSKGEILSVSYPNLVAALTKAIQEEDKKNELLREELKKQQLEIELLKAKLNQILLALPK